MIEDHHITRLEKGGMAQFIVEGSENPAVFEALQPGHGGPSGH
jgi:hypothetical protein